MMTTQPPQLHRHSSCRRHPSKPITGFCAACLRERLAGIDPDTHHETPVTRLAAELRRSKSYSSTTNPNASASTSNSTTTTTTSATTYTSEPRRKSCDVRSRNTLSDLFHTDDDKRKNGSNRKPKGLDLGLGLKEDEEIGVGVKISDELLASTANDKIGEGFEEDGELKTMKEFIDLEWEKKKNAMAGGFWEVASVFSKKIGKWQMNQKKKKENQKQTGVNGGLGKMEKKPKFSRDTQSEIGLYGFGRRSCDTDPRLSVDDSRYSFDEPRAPWDGYLIGKTFPQLTPLVSVVEDVKLQSSNGVGDLKHNVGLKNEGEEESSPGGTVQTRDYYSDRKTRRSFDRSSSNRRMSLGDDELKSISNAKVSSETVGLFHGAKLLVTEKELRDSNWYSIKDYQTEGVGPVCKDVVGSANGETNKNGFKFKKSQRWRGLWSIWGMMQRRSESKCRDEESSIGGNVGNEPNSESWQKLSEVSNGEANGIVSQKLIRSYTVSAKDSCKMACSSGGGIDAKENGTKRRDELQRNRSARYSPSNLDNGLLRFYLTPLRSYGRAKPGVSRLKNSHSMARNVL